MKLANETRPEIREADAREIHGIELIIALASQVNQCDDVLSERLHSVPDLWRQYRIALAALNKVSDGLFSTLDIRACRHMQNIIRIGEVVVRPKSAVKRPDDVQIVAEDDLRVLISEVVSAHCAICLKTGGQIRSCPLRRALMRIAPPDNTGMGSLCPYAHVAMNHSKDEYF